MVVLVSMQTEDGLQWSRKPYAEIDSKYPDLPASKWYDYGYKEGLLRLLEMFDRRKITSHKVGASVDLHSALATEIFQCGHEASGHGQTWTAVNLTHGFEKLTASRLSRYPHAYHPILHYRL